MNYKEVVFEIKSYDVDRNNKLKISSLFNYMQDIAGYHAEELNFGYGALKEKNLFWVLSRVLIKLKRAPIWNESLRIVTFPKGINKLFAVRDFIYYIGDEQIGASTSYWLLLNSQTLRPQRIESLNLQIIFDNKEHGLDASLEKLKYEGLLSVPLERNVYYNDIDVNNHVNNARYVEFIEDYFSAELMSGKTISNIQVNYLSEAKINDVLTIQSGYSEDGRSRFVDISNKNGSAKNIEAIVEFKNY